MSHDDLQHWVDARQFKTYAEVVAAGARKGLEVSGIDLKPEDPRAVDREKERALGTVIQAKVDANEVGSLDEIAALITAEGYYISGIDFRDPNAPQPRPPSGAQWFTPAAPGRQLLLAEPGSVAPDKPIVVNVYPQITVTPPDVVVNVPQQPSPVVNVSPQAPAVNVNVPTAEPTEVDIERNQDGSVKAIRRRKQGPRDQPFSIPSA